MFNIVSLDFKTRLNDAALIQFAANISQRIIDNPQFSSLKDEGLALQERVQTFSTTVMAASDGSRTKIAKKRRLKPELVADLEKLAAQVNVLANRDESIIFQAGFDVRRKQPSSRYAEISQVTRVKGRQGSQPGEVVLEFDAVPNALIYAAEWSADNGQTWHNGIYPSSRRAIIQGLPVRTDVLFRVCAIGTGQRKGLHSDPVRMFVA